VPPARQGDEAVRRCIARWNRQLPLNRSFAQFRQFKLLSPKGRVAVIAMRRGCSVDALGPRGGASGTIVFATKGRTALYAPTDVLRPDRSGGYSTIQIITGFGSKTVNARVDSGDGRLIVLSDTPAPLRKAVSGERQPRIRLIVLDRSIAGVDLGEKRSSVEEAWGKGRMADLPGIVTYLGGRLQVSYQGHDVLTNYVTSVSTTWPSFHTCSGIRVGMRRRDHPLSRLVYWYALYPVHHLIFEGMLRRIGRVAIARRRAEGHAAA
jgi:hypothetical protein